ncbi:MAG: hypothetical protein ACRDRH_28990 [Pseudonocardia sp.]
MFAALRAIPSRRAIPAPPPRRLLVWLISATNSQDHAVALEEMEAGVAAGQGTYRAVCGHLVRVCAMVIPPGPRCLSCEDLLTMPPSPKQRWWTAALRSVPLGGTR